MALDHNKALDLSREGQWGKAHTMISPFTDAMSCLIHGYLHRMEGDLNNARYWYNRANTTMPENTLEEEMNRIYELINTD
jgi:hypothetical protein